ncbi:hypothetical protein CapIbe_021971 [Capra ibex]
MVLCSWPLKKTFRWASVALNQSPCRPVVRKFMTSNHSSPSAGDSSPVADGTWLYSFLPSITFSLPVPRPSRPHLCKKRHSTECVQTLYWSWNIRQTPGHFLGRVGELVLALASTSTSSTGRSPWQQQSRVSGVKQELRVALLSVLRGPLEGNRPHSEASES